MWTRATAVLRSRLVHFGVIGALIFALAPSTRRTVDVSSATMATLRATEAARVAPAPLDAARAHAIDDRVLEDELLYREALRLSLDRGDPIVRQRLIQKLLLLVEDLGGASRTPTEPELRAYFDATRERWSRPARVRFVHVFASRRDALPRRASLPRTGRAAPPIGEPFPFPRDVTAALDQISLRYGATVRAAVERGDGEWSEPVSSPFGWHRVRVLERLPAQDASFAQARPQLELDFLLARRRRVVGAYLRKLATEYDIRIDGHPVTRFAPPLRVAVRTAPSAED